MKAIILDVDGTLWDSTDSVARAWNEKIEELTDWTLRVTGDQLKTVFGKPMNEIGDIVFAEYPKSERDEVYQKCMDNQKPRLLIDRPKLYPGVREGIIELSKRYKVFIVSNCFEGYIESLLDITDMHEYIADFTCPSYTGKLKADNIRIIMERNNIKEAFYVGDTLGDFTATKEAGIPFVFCRYGFSFGKVPEDECDYIIDFFSDLLKIDF